MSNYSRFLRCATVALSSFALFSLAFGLYPGVYSNVSAQKRETARSAAPLAVGTCDLTTAALPLEVEASAGVMGPVAYPNLQTAIAAINAGTHQGAINIEVCFSSAEPAGSSTLHSGDGAAAPANYTSVSIRPLASGLVISGDTGAGRGLIELNGADNVTIDGDNPNTAGTTRDLTLQNASALGTQYTSPIRIALNTTTVNSANNNTFRNLNLLGSAVGRNVAASTSSSSDVNTTYGVYASGSASGPTTAPTAIASVSTTIGNNAFATNMTIQNNSILNCARGIAVQGVGAGGFNGLLIENNTIGNATAADPNGVYSMGMTLQGFVAATIRGNTIYLESFVTANIRAIDVGGISNLNVAGAVVEKNRILRVHSRQGNNGAYGINIAGGNGHTVKNNFVANLNSVLASPTLTSTTGPHGIRIGANTSGHFVYNNSVNLYGAVLGATNIGVSSALTITNNTVSDTDVRNNILVNTMTGALAGTAVVPVFLGTGMAVGNNITLNNNDYFTNDLLGQSGTAALSTYTSAAFDASTTAGVNNWRSLTSTLTAAGTNDNASIKTDPLFISPTDPALGATSPAADAGVTIASVPDDIEGTARPVGAAYDIGADERIIPSAAGAIIAGRVLTANGNGLRGAVVMLTDSQGVTRTAMSSSFGYYRFEDVPTGATCIVTVVSKRFQFSPRVVTVNGDLFEVDIISN